jgi:lipopolysaccharide exporter
VSEVTASRATQSREMIDRSQPSWKQHRPLTSRVRRGVAWSLLSTLLLRLANFAVTAVVAHILAPRDFGVFTVAFTAYAIVSSLGELGVASCLVRGDLDLDAMAPTMVTVSVTTSAIFAGIMAAAAPQIATLLGSADGTGPVRVMALVFFLGGLSAVPSAQLTREFKQDKLFLASILSLLPSTAALLLLAKMGSGAMAFAWSRVIAQGVMCLVMTASVPRHYRPGLSRSAISILYRFGFPLAGANFINYILLNVDYAFIGHMTGAIPLGIYMLAFNLASIPTFLLGNVINGIAMPAFSRVTHDPNLLRNAMVNALRAVALILMPVCALLMVLARPLVDAVYGSKWDSATEVLAILACYGGISIICVLFANMLTSLGKAKFILVIQLVWFGALVPAMMLGVQRRGIVGAAAAHIVIIAPIVLPAYIIALKRATGIRVAALGKAVLRPLLGAAVAGFLSSITASQFTAPLLQLIVGGLVLCLVYVPLAVPREMLSRIYATAAQKAGLPVKNPAPRRRRRGKHRAPMAGLYGYILREGRQ